MKLFNSISMISDLMYNYIIIYTYNYIIRIIYMYNYIIIYIKKIVKILEKLIKYKLPSTKLAAMLFCTIEILSKCAWIELKKFWLFQ